MIIPFGFDLTMPTRDDPIVHSITFQTVILLLFVPVIIILIFIRKAVHSDVMAFGIVAVFGKDVLLFLLIVLALGVVLLLL